MIDLSEKDFFEIKNNFRPNKDVESQLLYGIRKKKPIVSIMVPTFLRNNYLVETIESALSQNTENTDVDYEIVVVDNNPDVCDEGTLSIMKKYDPNTVSYYKNRENIGMFGNWNRCLELSNAEWVLILHDDDTITPDYLSQMLKIVKNYPDVSCVGCAYRMIDGESKLLSEPRIGKKWQMANKYLQRESYPIETKDFYYIHPINIMGLFLNRKKAVEIGGFDNTWDPTSDYIFILNLAHRYKVRCTDKKLLNYRQAVNASLSIKHLIGMVEVDAFMRESINQHLRLMPADRSLEYRSAIALNHENGLAKSWFSKLSSEEKERVQYEYNDFNKFMGTKNVSTDYRSKVVKRQGFYQFWMQFFRR